MNKEIIYKADEESRDMVLLYATVCNYKDYSMQRLYGSRTKQEGGGKGEREREIIY